MGLRALASAQDDAQAEKIGTHWATEQVLDLLDNKALGVHLYTLNKSRTSLQIYETLGIQRFDQLVQ